MANRISEETRQTIKEKIKFEDDRKRFEFGEAAPYDPRFPNTNVTRHCFTSYVDFFRCQKLRGEDYEPCNYFQKVYLNICPNEWVEKWDEERENNAFPMKI